jgi:hypothetical protein
LPAFETHWSPFLQSGSSDTNTRRAALEALAGELLRDRDGSSVNGDRLSMVIGRAIALHGVDAPAEAGRVRD